MKKKILITGGAGYIGSHVINQLRTFGEHDVITVDNLSTGRKEAVVYGELIIGDIENTELLEWIISQNRIEAIMHFAGSIVVPESVKKPLAYYENNTLNSFKIIQLCQKYQINQFIFSSTAAVYGEIKSGIADELSPTNPINPYGRTKLMTEWMLEDYARSNPQFNYVALRYFNVAGASLDGRIGQSTPQATHLLKAACEAAVGKRDKMYIFGDDYETNDGTGIRDFIHIDDLARAHISALQHLMSGGRSQVLNCGYGSGHSVKEVIEMTKKISGVNFGVEIAPRRSGDCAIVMSYAERIKEILKWQPQHNDLEIIVRSALEWEKKCLA